MTKEEKQRGLELQGYIDSIRDMTIKEIAIKHLKKYHLPKFLAGLLVKFSTPLLLAKDYELTELEKACDETQELLDKQIEATYKLDKENAELKADNDARKFAMAMSEKVEKQLREENAELKALTETKLKDGTSLLNAMIMKNLADQLTNAKELLKNILAISVHDKRQCTYDAYILTVKEAEQFLKDSEVEK